MSKNRRKVTVEGEKSSDEEGGSKRSKPSVFERLGPGATSSRKSFEGERQDGGLYLEKCRNWLKTGSCHYGTTCRFIHGPFTSGRSKRKGGEGEEESGDEGKHRKHRTDKEKLKARSQSLSPKRSSRGHGRKEKDAKMKSAIIVKKSVGGGGDSERESDSAPWDADDNAFDDLDYKDELQLEQKRQELERVLRQLQPSEEERENITIEKKQLSSSSGSSSSSSGSSSSSSSSSSGSPSPPRKKSPRRRKTPPRHSRSPPRHYGKSPPYPARTPPSQTERPSPYRNKATPVPERSRSSPNRDPSPLSLRERPSKRETSPPPVQRERSPPGSPQRPASPRHSASSWSPEKGCGLGTKGGKAGGKKKKIEKQKEKPRSRMPHASSPPEWEQDVREKDKKRPSGSEKDKSSHREKHKRRNRSPLSEENPKSFVGDVSLSPRSRPRSKPKAVQSPSPEVDRKRSEGSGRQEAGSDYNSPVPKTSRRSVSPAKERSKRGKRRGRTLSVSPLRTKKPSPVPRSKDLPKETEREPRKEKVKGGSIERVFNQEKVSEQHMAKERSRGRSPPSSQATGKTEKHKKKKDYAEKKKRHDSPDVTPPPKHSRKRRDSPETPVKQSKRTSKERAGPETPGRRASKSKSGKRKEGRKGQKGQAPWEQSPNEPEGKGRSRGASESSKLRPSSPELPPSRARDKRHSSPQELFAGRSRSGDSRRPVTPPRRPESPPEVFRPGMRGSPPRFARSSRDDPNFSSGMRRRADDEFGRPPGSSSPSGRRSREGRYRDDFEPGLGRRDLDPDGPGRIDRFMDPRDRERLARYPDLRPPLYDEGPASRLEQERLFEMERVRFERETDRLRGQEGFERERFGRDRFSGRPDRFEDGRGGPLVGRDPRGLGVSAPPWERDYGGAAMSGRGLPGDRFPGRGGYDDLPDRLGRRGDWEGRHLDYRDDWGPRGREDRRGDLRMGRRGEFLDIRDGHRFEDPAMFRRMDREEMLRLRLEGEYRDRREPSNPRESLYVDLRREDRGERRDDRLERGEEAFERSRRDDHMDERLLRRDEREGGRMERRDNLRKRPFDLEDEKTQSPPTKRLREHSPSAASLRSHGSNLDDTRAADWERAELRRRDQSQETDRGRRDQESERPGKRGRDSEGDRFKRELDRSRERSANQESVNDAVGGESRSMDKEAEVEGEQRRDRRKRGEENDRPGGRRRGRDRSRLGGADREEEKEQEKLKEDEKREKSLGRASKEGGEREADRESVKSGSRESAKEREWRRGRSANREGEKDSETMSEKIGSGEKGWAPDQERDRDTQSEKAWPRGERERDEKGSLSGRSRQGERPRSEYGDGDRGRGRERRRRGTNERGNLQRGDNESDRASSKGSAKGKSIERENEVLGENERKDTHTGQSPPEVIDKAGDVSEKYDPFAVESDDEQIEGGAQKHVKTRPQITGIAQKSAKPKRHLSPQAVSTDIDEVGDRKKQKMIELSEGNLSETPQPELKREEELRSVSLPFTGDVSDKDELKSAGGEVYSDWSSADDADEILGRPEAAPFASRTKPADMENCDSQSIRSNQDRRRRSPSRSSHGSRRDRVRDDHMVDDRGRARSREDRTRDERGRRSRPSSRHSSRHSSYDPRREDRRRYGSTEPAAWDRYERGDGKQEMNQVEGSKAQSLQPDEDDGCDKSDLLATSMDYETISDDGDIGVEEEPEVYKGVVSALNIDWSSLTQDQRPTPKSGSALQRFKPASVFQRIGIEKAYAGEELFSKLKSLCQAEIEKEEVPKGPCENGEAAAENGTDEPADTKDTTSAFKLHHDTAAFHASTVCKLKERLNLFRNIGSFRRALCARRDLDIRRHLCRLDKIQIKGRRLVVHPPLTGQT